MKTLMLFGFGTLLVGLTLGSLRARAGGSSLPKDGRRIEVEGHRGARAARPENTLPAFDYALEQGVDVLELDVGVSRDGHLVVSHDAHVNSEICTGELASKRPLVHELTLSQLRTLDCGSKRPRRFPRQVLVPGTTMPTLGEVFAFVKASKHPAAATVRFNIETKIDPAHPEDTLLPDAFADLLVAEIKKHGMLGRSVIQSFDPRTLVAAKRIEPNVRISFLSEDSRHDLAKIARELGAEIVSPQWNHLNRRKVSELQRQGTLVVPWTANSKRAWHTLASLGVDGIITDDPKGLIDWLKAQGLR